MLLRNRLKITAAAVLVATQAQAQVAPDAPAQIAPGATPDTPAPSVDEQPDIVVTGRAAGSGIRKLEAGYSITSLSADDLLIQNPKSAGDALKSIPGIFVESSGGVGTANVFVRGIPSTGDAPFVTFQFNGVPVYGASSPSFMDQSALVRFDETVATVEAVNGGPASLFSDGQPGLTANLLLREGREETEGSVKVSSTEYGARRVDGVLSGKIADDLFYVIGGYVSSGDSVRTAGFDTEKGGQVSVNITKRFDTGKFNVFARYTDDHGEWFLPFAADVPGLNLGTYNQLNNNTRYQTIIVPGSAGSGATQRFDFGSGRGWKGVIAGGNLTNDFGSGITFADHFGYTKGTLQTAGLVPAGAGAITVATALASPGNLLTPGQTTVQTLHTGQTLASTDYVQQFGGWVVLKDLSYISNEATLTYATGGNRLTVGYYFSHFSSNDAWSLGNNTWQQVGGSVDTVNLNNGPISSFAIADFGSADENAIYLADSYNITDALRVDAGVRYQSEKINFHIEGNGQPSTLNEERHSVPWTVGVNYRILSTLDVYGRVSQGYHIPSFDDVRSQLGNTSAPTDQNWSIRSYEIGTKYRDHAFDVSLSGFYDKVVGAVYNDVGVPAVVAGSKTYGLEVDARWTSSFGLSIATNDVLEDAKTDDPLQPGINGKRAERIPSYQARITPAYEFKLPGLLTTIYGTYEAVGKRYSDLANIQPLPAYATFSAGILATRGPVTIQVAADNLTNSHGLTEGNPRFLAGPGTALPVVRPIFGRSFRFTGGFKF
ncbi:TonB-dependent receptor domain-containing protein [Glacieibacterium megasporae]|uniref:TonB-dependent receptor domain-containing protein n=1 Tax=Glacieibacterium megasporae TaxID=2835787 RepID=UPI001C1DEDDF|nr:TonB-dependent receptor [Polymorphobacter megasporae]UAJ08908.1 TonB-dependent receptor [Polymorphobacter megasporae]